ncbi:UvrC [Desulforapulum autotrophicum HRM2]|uniref:UvrABC system protein C n=1 Tax=Desulforapulum autotrophicum (strain ATCC 43914 / DSM 3382 / VKM B-1955 / HRM2) TaxID=177437 RepID=UVRC_DESAH|nr:excinuclease ABC subunit UvrC [Desulforapulum autotrophicum]C0QET6.1 RecName: Full=UvrABC system protein C; Short=Protein UvrC; AltName: Full=Excinuclease ABC subunit C [Desulforapulum autotrophicum HRM2]ACN15428.1 UvrC [Desulforapulum autotrophicum HRM2]
MTPSVLERYQSAPQNPGVYLMKDKRGTIIYVGKALNLKKRLASYFARETGHDMKTGVLLKKVVDFDLIVTATEHEALILESTLIKKHSPRYNVILKDGKSYPCLRIDTSKPFPALEVVRKIGDDNAVYFGPYSSVQSVRSTIKQVNKIFKLRKCRDVQFANRTRPCLNYQINACLGACCNRVSRQEYARVVGDVILFLKGRAPDLINRLKFEMQTEADLEHFERAAQIRDTILAIQTTLERQVVVSTDRTDRDVIACAINGEKAVVTILFVRSGNLVGSRNYPFDTGLSGVPEILDAFVRHYYERSLFIPGQILIAEKIENHGLVQDLLIEKRGKRVSLVVPERGDKRRLVEMALVNAQKELEKNLSIQNEAWETLTALQTILGMSVYPRRIECFDNSNMAGTDPVSSMVVFVDGLACKSEYRKFIIRDAKENDDYACMTEVLTRRLSSTEAPLPDLLVVDGGKGQLSMAVAVLKSLGLENRFQVAGLAKKDAKLGEVYDKIYLPGRANPVNTRGALKALYLVQRLRDEAHRFAITFQRKRRSKRAGTSVLDAVPGIGKKRKQVLMTTYKGISRMGQATVEELASLPGMTLAAAQQVKSALALDKD